jgi:hypothetical protein
MNNNKVLGISFTQNQGGMMVGNILFAYLRLRILLITANMILCVLSFLILQGVYLQNVNANSEINVADGLSFSEPVNLTNNLRDSVYAQVASHGSNVYIVWQENRPSLVASNDNERNYDILIKKSIDGGLTFGKEINLSQNPGFSEHPQIAASGNNVYVVWIDNSPVTGSSETSENKKILLRKSIDQGNTFGETSTLSSTNNVDSFNQEITAAGNNVYVVWQDVPLPIADDTDIISGGQDSSVYNYGQNNSNINHQKYGSIMFTSSEDGGESFIQPKSLSNGAYKSYPKVGAYEDSVYVVWNVGIIGDTSSVDSQNDMTPNGIFFARSFDNGVNFSDPLKLNTELDTIGESQVAASGKNVYVVWGGNPDEKVVGNLYFTRSADSGATFSTPQSLTEKNTLNVEVAADNSNAYVAWQGVLPDGNEEIFVKESLDAGVTFTMTNKNISRNEGISECTSIAISQVTKVVYLAWEDSPEDNHEILLSQGV